MKNYNFENIFDYIKIPKEQVLMCEIKESFHSLPIISIEARYEPSMLVQEKYNNITISDSGIKLTNINTVTNSCQLKVDKIETEIEKKKGDNMEKINNILNLYKTYQIKEIDRQCDEDVKFIRETSELAKVKDKLEKQAKKELEKLYPDKDYKEIENLIYISYECDDKTRKDIEERLNYRTEQLEKLEQKLDNVKALIDIAELFEQKMNILESYEIIDEDWKIKEW